MYARTYPAGIGTDPERKRETRPGIRPEELLIPQNYHGEMLRSSRRREDGEREEPPERRPAEEPSAAEMPEERTDGQTAEREDAQISVQPQKTEKGLLSGLSELLFGHGADREKGGEGDENPLPLLGLLLLVSGGLREREKGENGGGLLSFADEDDFVLLLLLFLLLT